MSRRLDDVPGSLRPGRSNAAGLLVGGERSAGPAGPGVRSGRPGRGLWALAVVAAGPAVAWASGGGAEPTGGAETGAMEMTHRMMLLALQVGVILFAAKIGNILFERIKLPGALGELVAGILIGPYLLGGVAFYGLSGGLFPPVDGHVISPELNGLTAIAAIVLLFMAGLETDIQLLLRYSLAGGLVGLGGVIASLSLGIGVAWLLAGPLLGISAGPLSPTSLFLGIILSATSVGITARILSERRKLDSPEGVTILSAAVIDDVVGIILLAIVLGVAAASQTGRIDWGHIGLIGGKAVGVWVLATAVGLLASRKISFLLKLFGRRTSVAVMALGLAIILAGLFEEAGLAMIIGAFVMGLSLSRSDISHMVRERLQPVYLLLIPIFFAVMGMRIDLTAMGSASVIAFGLVYAVAALASKVVGCGLPALPAGFNTLGAMRIGFGMAPRCEVALIIAGLGLAAGVLTPALFAAVIVMVLVNSVVAPAALAVLYRSPRRGTRKAVDRRDDRHHVDFDFPSREMAEFVLERLTSVFEAEGFFVHLLDSRTRLYQLRKDTAVIDLHIEASRLTFDCDVSEIPLINTAMHEAVAELERAIRGLQHPVDHEAIAGRIQHAHQRAGKGMLDLRQYLTPSLIVPELSAETKAEVIDELLAVLEQNGHVRDVEAARRAVWQREESMSTGLQHGVAIPHGKTDTVDRLVCAVGIKTGGLDFASMDAQPSRIFILTLSPESKPAPHVQFMSTVSQVLDEDGRRRILACRTPAEYYHAFTAPAPAAPAGRAAVATPGTASPPAAPRFRLAAYLDTDVLVPDLHARTSEEAIEELVAVLASAGRVGDPETVVAAVLDRERQMPTGMAEGVAIPHARTGAVDRLICAIGLCPAGLDFGASDGKATRIVVLAITPTEGTDPYLQFAAAVIGALDEPGRRKLLASATAQEMLEVLAPSQGVVSSSSSPANPPTTTQP